MNDDGDGKVRCTYSGGDAVSPCPGALWLSECVALDLYLLKQSSASRRDRVPTPQPPTIIDLCQDDELDDPTYSPHAPKRPPASPHKTTPRRRKLSDSAHLQSPVPWKGLGQATLNSFIQSPTKKAKTQSTMHSFFGTSGLTSPPRLEAKPRPSSVPPKWLRLAVPELERLLQEEMATAMLLSKEARQREQKQEQEQEQVVSSAGQRPAVARSVISIAGTPTPPGVSPIAGPSNYNKGFLFEDNSQTTTMTSTAMPVTTATPIGSLLYPGGSSSVAPVNPAPQRGWESPVKRKFSEIVDSQEPNSLISEPSAYHPSQVQTRASITPDPAVRPSSGKLAKPIQPELRRPPRTAPPKIAVPTSPRIKQSQVPIPIGSPRKSIDLTASPTRTISTRRNNVPLATMKDAREGTNDASDFEETIHPTPTNPTARRTIHGIPTCPRSSNTYQIKAAAISFAERKGFLGTYRFLGRVSRVWFVTGTRLLLRNVD
ncbi:hypothetical protein BGX38DRAFT_231676 [Terfezia claveryi]|nr:hypothetical protein BGX38DRAFT_231676 [Terfezia claveryi]